MCNNNVFGGNGGCGWIILLIIILCCTTGLGVSMAANKVKGIRAAVCTNEMLAEMSITEFFTIFYICKKRYSSFMATAIKPC